MSPFTPAKLLLCLVLTVSLASADYDPAEAREYAYASALSHCEPDAILSWTCGAACVNLTGYQGYYAEVYNVTVDQTLSYAMIVNPTTKKFVTTFRGTVGSLQMLLEILEGTATPYTLSNVTGAECETYFYTHYSKNVRPSVIEHLTAAYKQYPDYQFIITGHSLGAALATLTAFDIITSGVIPRDQVIMYNYGSPRVGNLAYVQAVEAAIPVLYRVVHWKDLVPHVPPCQVKSGACVASMEEGDNEGAGYLWPAWHVATQAFYNQDNTDYTICVGDEDPKCMDQFELVQTEPADHDYYVNVHISCEGSSVFKVQPTRQTILELVLQGKIQGDDVFSIFDEILQ